MSHRLFTRIALLPLSLFAVGCGPDPNDEPFGRPVASPQDSGMDRPVILEPERREVGTGFPDRLHAGLARAVRGETEIRVESVNAGERLVVSVLVHTRGEKALPCDGWADAASVTLRDPNGQAFHPIPQSAEQLKLDREWQAAHPEHGIGLGAGDVIRSRPRLVTFQFDAAAAGGGHLDLDLSGSAVGQADPFLFRIPARMIVAPALVMPTAPPKGAP